MTEDHSGPGKTSKEAAPVSSSAAFAEGLKLFGLKEYEAAASKLEEAIGHFPEGAEDKATALTRLGHVRMLQQRYTDAGPVLERAVKLSRNPQQEIEARSLLGKTRAHLGLHEAAGEEYQRVMKFLMTRMNEIREAPDRESPENQQILGNLRISAAEISYASGVSLAHLGATENAALMIHQATLFDPGKMEYRDQLQPFLPALKIALEKRQAVRYTQIALGLAEAFEAHAASVSAKLTKEARLLWPANEQIRQKADFLASRQGGTAPALDDSRAKEIASVFNSVGHEIMVQFDDLDTADILWEEALRLVPENPMYSFFHAIALVDQEKFPEADALLMELIEHLEINDPLNDPKQEESFKKDVESLAGIVSSRLGRHEAAYLLLKNSGPPEISYPFLQPLYFNAVGNTMRALGAAEGALPFLEQAVVMATETGQREEFLADVREAMKTMPRPAAALQPETP